MVEVAPLQLNNVLRLFFYLVVIRSGAGEELVRLVPVGGGDLVGAPRLVGACTGALCRLPAEVQVMVSSSSLAGLFVAFLCLLLWIVSVGQEEAGGRVRSMFLMADVWLTRMCCSLPMFGVWISIWETAGGWSSFRFVLRAEKRRRSGSLL
ncbi:unnamed protein product [Urochloa humidicola]